VLTRLRQHALQVFKEVLLGYAWVSLAPSWKPGALLALITFIDPATGAVGLLGALCAWYAGHLAGAEAGERPVCVFNGLLSGLFVAHVWTAGVSVLALGVMGGVLCGWLTVVLGRLSWSLIGLPILSLPFALVAMLTAAAGGSLSTLHFNPYVAPPDLFANQADKFLSAFGTLYFMPNPFVGLLILALILVLSRYYFVIALLGYAAALLWLRLLGAAPEHLASTAWDSNAILAALLVGGLFARPSLLTAALATLAAVIAAWLALTLGRMLDASHLLPFSAPFILASWLVLYAAVHNKRMAGSFNIPAADFPERSHERAQISRARLGTPGSIPVAPPFSGAWTVSRGFSGSDTHSGQRQYALDFTVSRDGKSFAYAGQRLEDFYCYDQPVLSPVYGEVCRVVNDLPDMQPGAASDDASWGNCVAIRIHDGKVALLAHLKPGSVAVVPGTWVKPGDIIGHCGNSGHSPQPHIHLQLQTGAEPGATTVPFHLSSVLISDTGEKAPRYELAVAPQESATLAGAGAGDVRPFHLLAGHSLRYTVTHNGKLADWTLRCEADAQGRLALVSSAGGRCLAESTWAVFSCYDRDGAADPCLDLWLLACGYTPASAQAERWQDSTPARLLPHAGAKWLAALAWPAASFARSSYRRQWDGAAQAWRQTVHHRQKMSGIEADAEALIDPVLGCTHITATVGGSRYTLQAASPDIGTPAREVTPGVVQSQKFQET